VFPAPAESETTAVGSVAGGSLWLQAASARLNNTAR